jgi:sugar phosphate permease
MNPKKLVTEVGIAAYFILLVLAAILAYKHPEIILAILIVIVGSFIFFISMMLASLASSVLDLENISSTHSNIFEQKVNLMKTTKGDSDVENEG